MPIPGVQAYAKCSVCGTVMWTDDADCPQMCVCKCGACCICEADVTGPIDETFSAATLEDLIIAEAG